MCSGYSSGDPGYIYIYKCGCYFRPVAHTTSPLHCSHRKERASLKPKRPCGSLGLSLSDVCVLYQCLLLSQKPASGICMYKKVKYVEHLSLLFLENRSLWTWPFAHFRSATFFITLLWDSKKRRRKWRVTCRVIESLKRCLGTPPSAYTNFLLWRFEFPSWKKKHKTISLFSFERGFRGILACLMRPNFKGY